MAFSGRRTRVSTYVSAWMPTGDETPQAPSSIEVLLVGGGGTGGSANVNKGGAGGGGGGVYSSVASNPGGGPGGTVQPVTSISAGVTYTITVGGPATASTFAAPTISTITANAGATGGADGSTGGTAGTYTGQPLAYAGSGGGGSNPPGQVGGGGGGAGSAGGSSSSISPDPNYNIGSAGGNSKANSISGSTKYYGGGGGGGQSNNYLGSAGQGIPVNPAETEWGWGGNGAAAPLPGGPAAGSAGNGGICILRYPDTLPLAASTTGSPTQTTTGGYHIYQWSASGSIAW